MCFADEIRCYSDGIRCYVDGIRCYAYSITYYVDRIIHDNRLNTYILIKLEHFNSIY